jgi:hypothetical protein
VVVDDYVRIVADAERAHSLGEPVRRGDLRRHRVFGIGDIAGPVRVDCAGHVRIIVLVARSEVLGFLASFAQIRLLHVSPYVHHADVVVLQMVGEPVRRDQGIEILHATP